MILAQAIAGLQQPPPPAQDKVKVKEPERFSGRDANRYRPFIMSCEIVFAARPNTYRNDHAKIAYAISFLTDSAQLWYEPYFLNPPIPPPRFTYSWPHWKEELRLLFGNLNAENEAEYKLRRLRMSESHKVNKYAVDFNNLASQTSWGDEALTAAFYEGLADRLKDRIADRPGGRPRDLNTLRRIAQDYDAHYWQRHEEKGRTSASSGTPSASRGNPSQPRSNPSPSTSSSSRPPAPSDRPRPQRPDLSGKLSNDGKLTSDERQRRMQNNLCLYCGKGGHKATECSLAKANTNRNKTPSTLAPKARAATIEEIPENSTSDSSENH
jgi:hypothetical protein